MRKFLFFSKGITMFSLLELLRNDSALARSSGGTISNFFFLSYLLSINLLLTALSTA